MNRLRAAWLALRASLWFVPTVITVVSVLAALLLVEAQDLTGASWARQWPRLFGASADGSRAMLAAIATSMITVAGVVFSITVVALSLASSQYSPRVLRNYMSDRTTQVVFGVFVGLFAYCLVVLRVLRGPGDGEFVPSLAVLGGVVYAFGGIGLLIYFIHHVADSIQASSIIARITGDTLDTVDRLFPTEIAQPVDDAEQADAQMPTLWTPVPSQRSGYLAGVDGVRLVECATSCGRVLHLVPSIGDFVVEGELIAELGGKQPVDEAVAQTICDSVHLDDQRTTDQDPAFGVQQLVDVAVRALSPGINDPSTACQCIDRLSSVMVRLAGRSPPQARRMCDGQLRLVAHPADFDSLLSLSFAAIVAHSRGDIAVLRRVVGALRSIERVTRRPERRHALAQMTRMSAAELRRVRPRSSARLVREQARALQERLADAV